ncbi:MAG: hypothetical protein IJL14_04800, partial [Selenomonadaceae bacterium]|nr:hypothetical protein [Selenomonadaceae bacterium]
MAEPIKRERIRSSRRVTFNESNFSQEQELGKRMDRLEHRMDKLEEKVDKLDEKIDKTRNEFNGRIDKLSDKIDDLHKEIKSSSNHGQIATISSVGIGLSAVSITLGVLYALIFK